MIDVARAFGGEVSGDQMLALGPYHSRRDRSLSVKNLGDGPRLPRPREVAARRGSLRAHSGRRAASAGGEGRLR